MASVTNGNLKLDFTEKQHGLGCGTLFWANFHLRYTGWDLSDLTFKRRIADKRRDGTLVKWLHKSGLLVKLTELTRGKMVIMVDNVNIESGLRVANHGSTETKFVMQALADYPQHYGVTVISPGMFNPNYEFNSMLRGMIWTPSFGDGRAVTAMKPRISGVNLWQEKPEARTYRQHRHYSLLATGGHEQHPPTARKRTKRAALRKIVNTL